MHNDPAKLDLTKPVTAIEEAGYYDASGEQVYYVLHRSPKPVAKILLAGHSATERTFSYASWVRWARYLAERNISAIRFDYRGCGESTGKFDNYTLSSWRDDCSTMAGFLEKKEPGVPMILMGIGLGGLLVSHLFQEGLGAAMLLWSPSSNGKDALRDMLFKRMSFEFTNVQSQKREDYKTILERGDPIEAAGYTLTSALWREATEMQLVLPKNGKDCGGCSQGRSWKMTKLKQTHVPLVAGGGLWQALNPGLRMRRIALTPYLNDLFEDNVHWLYRALGQAETI